MTTGNRPSISPTGTRSPGTAGNSAATPRALGNPIAAPAPPRTFLLLYNPARMSWPDRDAALRRTQQGDPFRRRWSTGIRSTGIQPGDTALLIRMGSPQRGLIGTGAFVSPCLPDPDGSGNGRTRFLAQVSFRELTTDAGMLPLDVLAAEAPWSGWQYLQGSGVRVPPPVAQEVLVLWRRWRPLDTITLARPPLPQVLPQKV